MHKKDWVDAFHKIAPVELDTRGEGWCKKAAVIKSYMSNQHLTRATAWSHFSKWAEHLFDSVKESGGSTVYIRLKEGGV